GRGNRAANRRARTIGLLRRLCDDASDVVNGQARNRAVFEREEPRINATRNAAERQRRKLRSLLRENRGDDRARKACEWRRGAACLLHVHVGQSYAVNLYGVNSKRRRRLVPQRRRDGDNLFLRLI